MKTIQRQPAAQSVPHKLALGHALALGRARNISAQRQRQADGQGRSHVRQIKTALPARQAADAAVAKIHFDSAHFRRDIAAKAL